MTTSVETAKDYDLRVVRFTLDPNEEQVRILESHIGAVRFTYNRLLGALEDNRKQRAAEADAGVAEDERTPWLPNTAFGLSKFFNAHKDEWCVNRDTGERWWVQNSTYAYESACVMLGDAYQNFFKSLSGKRRGRKVGPPRFKSRRDSVGVTFRGRGLYFDATRPMPQRRGASMNRITLPKVGSVRFFEDVNPLVLEEGTVVQRATVRKRRGRWVAAVLFRVAPRVPDSVPGGGSIALDLGAAGDGSNIIVGVNSAGEIVYRLEYPQSLRDLDARKRALQYRGRNKNTGARGVAASARGKQHLERVAKIDHQIANIRDHLLHTATDYLTRTYSEILIEGMDVNAMLASKKVKGERRAHMNRLVSWSAFATVRQQLEYKAKRTGAVVVVVPATQVTNRTCSECGNVKDAADWQALHHDQMFVCKTCGARNPRAVNTANNLRALASTGA